MYAMEEGAAAVQENLGVRRLHNLYEVVDVDLEQLQELCTAGSADGAEVRGVTTMPGMVWSSSGCEGNVPTASATYEAATSRAVSEAAQKNGGLNAQPIWRADGTTISTGWPGWFGRTYAKLYSSPSALFNRQKPSFTSHFAIKIFASSGASANAWMSRFNT